jgi:hypothetical protein
MTVLRLYAIEPPLSRNLRAIGEVKRAAVIRFVA